MKKLHLPVFCIFCIALTGCASFYIHGSDPVKRAIQAAELLIDGRTSGDYIKVFNTESAKAEIHIAGMIEKAKREPMFYTEISDRIEDWLLLYRCISILQQRYPNGLSGEKEQVFFESKDYTSFSEEVFVKASEALFEQAVTIRSQSGGIAKRAVGALDFLRRTKKYSRHLDDKVSQLGADICFAAAEEYEASGNSAYGRKKPEEFVKAAEFFRQAENWLAGYKNSAQRANTAHNKAVLLYMEEGRDESRFEDYASLRRAKAAYLKAESLTAGAALKELSKVNEKLTIKLIVIFKGTFSSYPNENAVRKAIQEKVKSSSYGPDSIEINFIRENGWYGFLFAEHYRADLALVPASDFGTVKEVYGPVYTSVTPVFKNIEGIVYSGKIKEQNQEVTVFFQNDYELYDLRNWRKKELALFKNESYKTTKKFTMRSYEGDTEARPSNFETGYLYISGQYNTFFPEFLRQNQNFAVLVQNFGTLNETGTQLCKIIENLN